MNEVVGFLLSRTFLKCSNQQLSSDDNYDIQSVFLTTVLAALIFLLIRIICYTSTSMNKKINSDDELIEIPSAQGAIPVLGHALSYRNDPSGFLLKLKKECGNIFKLNLAGKMMIMVCGPEEQRQLANVPESRLSLQHAVAEIGFEQTLGTLNVYRGTNLHKGIIKGVFRTDPDSQLIAWISAIKDATDVETKIIDGDDKIEFLHLIRRIMLRATIEVFIGKSFLRNWEGFDFVKEFQELQDSIEDVTAKAVALPKMLALFIMLWPLKRRRESFQIIIKERLEKILQLDQNVDGKNINDDGEIGFWLRSVLDKNLKISDIAEYIVGLLFAGHKNPAIGAAQSYLLMREHAANKVLVRCQDEGEKLLSVKKPNISYLKSSCPTLRRICLESLRLIAHSIGGIRVCKETMTVSVKLDDETNRNEIRYKIPKGSTIGFVHIASSLDTSIWGEDAKVFDADQHRSEDLYINDYNFTAFSNGVHKCPGQQLAMILLQVLVAVILTEYDVVLPEKIPNLCFERATLAQRKGPVMVSIIHKRQ